MTKPYKILWISDHPLVPSGVGGQAKLLIERLLETGKYSFICLGGAIQHPDYTPQRVAPEKFGDRWLIIPINGYGDRNMMRQLLLSEKPDAVFIFTDPRFFYWIWEMEDEVRSVCPLVYWHVWDNDPTPRYNLPFYESTDFVSALSLKTYGILQDMGYSRDRFNYIPHSLPEQLFKPLPEEESLKFKRDTFGAHRDKRFVVFWNNRNARRKQTGDVVACFAKFADWVGRDNVALFMHTQAKDPEGQDIIAVARAYGIEDNLLLSEARVDAPVLNRIYNVVDCTINISCFIAGTKVTTIDGYRPIEEVTEGDLVLTHRGRWMPVIRTYSGLNHKPLYTIRATNCDAITTTEEHPFLVIKRKDVDFFINENLGALREMARWIKAKDLEVGDYLVSEEDVSLTVYSDRYLDVWKHAKDKRYALRDGIERSTYSLVDGKIIHNTGNHGFAAYERLKLDKDLAYIFGEWVADGSTNSCMVSFNKRDRERAELLASKYAKVFGNDAYVRDREKHLDVCLKNPAIYSLLLMEHCGRYSEGKRVPEVVMRGTDEIKRAFLAGYMAGDGCSLIHNQHGTVTHRMRTISSKLACDLRMLLVSLGYCPSVHEEDNPGSYREGARIWTIQWRDRKRANNGSCRSWNDGRGVITRIFDIEVNDNEDGIEVYNFEVVEDHSYHVENVVAKNSNEGFGLSTLESLFSGTPIVAHMTGGLQYQMGDWYRDQVDFRDQEKLTELAKKRWRKQDGFSWWGVPVFPASRSCTGSQQIPYIYDDRVSHDDVVDALEQVYRMGRSKRRELGLRAREWAVQNFNQDRMVADWDRVLEEQIEKHRKFGYRSNRTVTL